MTIKTIVPALRCVDPPVKTETLTVTGRYTSGFEASSLTLCGPDIPQDAQLGDYWTNLIVETKYPYDATAFMQGAVQQSYSKEASEKATMWIQTPPERQPRSVIKLMHYVP